MGPLHIGFDAQISCRQAHGGISRYFADLSSHLQHAGIRVSSVSSSSRWWRHRPPWRQADLVHATFYGGRPYRLRKGQGLVSSLFDMTPERHPEHFFLPALRSPHANKLAWLSASDLIISISSASADDLSFFLPSLRTPVEVIHLATSIGQIVTQKVDSLAGRRFWLMVGKRHAYKNGLTLMRSLASLQLAGKITREFPLLVFAGGGAWRAAERKWISDHFLENAVLQLSANDGMLAWLYRHAEAVLVPSLAEGFSLPLIEALACDTPVVASDLEVHREVGKGFATFLSPLNASVWADWLSIHSSVAPERPSSCLGINEYGRLRHYYSMERLVDQHIDAYQSISFFP